MQIVWAWMTKEPTEERTGMTNSGSDTADLRDCDRNLVQKKNKNMLIVTEYSEDVRDKPRTDASISPANTSNHNNRRILLVTLFVVFFLLRLYLCLGLFFAGLLEGGLDEAPDAVLVDAGERVEIEQALIADDTARGQ